MSATKSIYNDISTIQLTARIVGTVPDGDSLYRINRDVIAPQVECGFVATDYNARSYSSRSCSNAAAWAETHNGTTRGAKRCNRHRAIDERTRRNSKWGAGDPKQYLPIDALAEAQYEWQRYLDLKAAEAQDAVYDKVRTAARYILNHVQGTGTGGRLDGTTLKVLRELTDDATRYGYPLTNTTP